MSSANYDTRGVSQASQIVFLEKKVEDLELVIEQLKKQNAMLKENLNKAITIIDKLLHGEIQ
jgi:chaperonin cofactor prefoldin